MIRDTRDGDEEPCRSRQPTELERRRAAPRDWGREEKQVDERGSHPSSTDAADSGRVRPSVPDQALQRRAYDTGQLRAALDAYPVSRESIEQAVDCGLFMAHACPKRDYSSASPEDRVKYLNSLVDVTRGVLDTETWVVARDPDLQSSDDGWMIDHAIVVNERVLNSNRPEWLIEVVAHEARHQWQLEVMQGKREHPDGEDGLRRLLLARTDYKNSDLDLTRSYWTNELEIDAESFSRAARAAYEAESLGLRRHELKSKLAEAALEGYTNSNKQDDVNE